MFTSNLISQTTWLKVKLKLVACQLAKTNTHHLLRETDQMPLYFYFSLCYLLLEQPINNQQLVVNALLGKINEADSRLAHK